MLGLGSLFAHRAWVAVIANPLTIFLGAISYNLYIWHQIVARLVASSFRPATANPHDDPHWQMAVTVAAIVAAIAMGAAVTYLFERPIGRPARGWAAAVSRRVAARERTGVQHERQHVDAQDQDRRNGRHQRRGGEEREEAGAEQGEPAVRARRHPVALLVVQSAAGVTGAPQRHRRPKRRRPHADQSPHAALFSAGAPGTGSAAAGAEGCGVEPLSEYARKRDFDKTPEPSGKRARAKRAPTHRLRFVVQMHRASRLRRLPPRGRRRAQVVGDPQGPDARYGQERLAMHVEDHPFDYRDFEGIIPKGNYGAGEVIVWDRGW